jgi:hypothetical protein
MPVLNLEKPGRFKKVIQRNRLDCKLLKRSLVKEWSGDNERFLLGQLANAVVKLFVDEPTKEQIGRIQKEDIPNHFLETIRKGMGAPKKARGGTVQKSSAAKKPVAKKKGGMAFKSSR